MAVATKGGGGLATTGSSGGICTIFPGDCVEIFGLTSEAGKQLNGSNGVATKRLDNGRFEVRIGTEKRVTIKAGNLRIVHNGGSKVVGKLGFGEHDRQKEMEAAAMFRPGDLVEVVDLNTPTGREVNGKPGVVVEDWETPPDRVKVKVDLGRVMSRENFRHMTLKPCNLKKITLSSLTDEQRVSMGFLQDDPSSAPPPGSDQFSRVDMAVEVDAEASADAPLAAGDVVEVSGLASAAGQQLNGEKGVVLRCIVTDGRAEVRLPDGVKKLKFENLTRMDLDGGDRFMVEIFGLQSEGGRSLNGQRGFATCRNEETGRFEVKINKDKKVSLKPENLRLLNHAK